MKLLTRLLLLLVVALGVATNSRADTGRLYTADRLSSGLVTCICQDHYGFIWIGTEYGLNKFDGYRYTAYHHQRNDSTSLANNEISELFVDRDGTLWVGCSKGLARYDYEHDCFERYRFPDDRQPRVTALAQNSRGDLIIGTAGYGLYSLQKGTHHIHYESPFNRRQADVFYSRIHIDRQGNLWRSSHLSAITRFTISNDQPTALRDFQSDCGQPVKFVEYSPSTMLIVCMYGIMSYSYKTGELERADFDLSLIDRNVGIADATIDHAGNLYIATSGSGLMVIPKGAKRLQRVENTSTHINLTTANVVDVIEDRNNNIWAACYNKGVLLFTKQEAAFRSWSFSSQHYATGGNVSSLADGNDGTIWCSVQNNGVYQWDADGHIIGHPSSPAGTQLIYRDRQGQYWLTTENTLYRYDPTTGSATPEQTFAGRGLNCMTDDGQGRLYISIFAMGLCIYDTHSHQSQIVSMQQTNRPGGYLCNDWIKAMQFDSRGMLWICTTNGVAMMNPDGIVFNSRGWNALLEDQQSYAVCEIDGGDMLIGTETGLYRYSWKQNKIEEAPHAEALHDKMICAIVRDRRGELWLSTSLGIWQYSPQRQQTIGYIGGNGLTTKEYVLGAALHRANGDIFFGTPDGIVCFSPADIGKLEQRLGKAHLTRFTCNGHSLNPMLDSYTLRNRDNTFTLEFSLLDYQNADNIAFQYRVNGAKTWMQTGEGANQITFTQLPAGHYTIEVRATSNGITSDEVYTVQIDVQQPWYRSFWAYLLYALIVAGFLGLILFNFERQRKRDLEESKMQFLINATHDIRSPLTLIMGPLEKLKQRLTGNENQSDLDTIDKNAKRLLLLVNQILDERKLDKHQMKLSCAETDMTTFINGIFKLYEYNARQRDISYAFEHPDEPVTAWIDRIQFDKVVSNLLSNAFKYTPDGGSITLRLSQPIDHASVQIDVIDTGSGFDDDKTERFFERFYQGRRPKNKHLDGTGIGLNLCRALTELHGGKISAQNRKDGTTGAILTVVLPQGNAHLRPEQIDTQASVLPQQPQGKRQASRNLHILLVDDDAEIANYIRHELGDWYKFDYAPNGREALRMLLAQLAGADGKRYDLVVSDVMMPEMDGITLLRSIKSNSNISDIPVILLTSKSEVSFRLEGLKKGADAYLSKPFSMEELHVQIDNLVDNVRRLRGKFSGAQEQEDRIAPVQVRGNNDVLMERVMRCVNENLSNPDFDVEQLTRDVGISRAQLHRKMKELTGISTSEFIRNLRLEQAARLIREKKINITQVAYSVGFNNQTHFSTVFKKHFGMTPTEYAERPQG